MNVFLKLLSCVKDSYLPALIALIALFFCALNPSLEGSALLSLNVTFLAGCFINFTVLLFSKDLKNTFFTLILLLCYLTLAKVTHTPLADSALIGRWLTVIMPVNLFLISFIEPKEKHAFFLLCFFLLEAALIENLYISNIAFLPEFAGTVGKILWGALLVYFLVLISIYPSIKNNAFFFESILFCLAVLHLSNLHYFLVCLTGAVFSNLLTNIHQLIYEYFRDSVTGCYSKNSFPAFDSKKLPPKYTIAFFCIDNYHKILQVFKKNLTDKLTKMILKRIVSVEPKALVYRLKDDEFCLIFFEQDVKQTFETVENMRRLVAGTEFVLGPRKILKLTITPVVSEKHRNDANAAVVLERMHKNFDRRYKFTQNMTFCEELEQKKVKTPLNTRYRSR